MATIDDVKAYVLALPEKEKNKLLIQLLKKAPETIDKLYYENVAGAESIGLLVEDIKTEISGLIRRHVHRSGIIQKNLAKGISASLKAVDKYKGILSAAQEGELLLYLLDLLFRDFGDLLGTCWTVFDYKMAQTLSRLSTLVRKKLHEDYRIEYEDKVNAYLMRIKKEASRIDYIFNMPERLQY